ncbi:FHA domain-containing protein [Vulgatibacter sp.]|uniref:FHA domain-containing protein n=1 Tax=Vulgatibacter sp. TaxID=1971226 RepID=UPI0035683583
MSGPFDEWDHTVPGGIPLDDLQRYSRAAVLEQIRGPGAPQRHLLVESRIVIGRTEGDIRIASAELSRSHLKIERAGTEYACTDLDSSNGVYLNGVKIHSAVLREGDLLQLGDVIFVFHAGAA